MMFEILYLVLPPPTTIIEAVGLISVIMISAESNFLRTFKFVTILV